MLEFVECGLYLMEVSEARRVPEVREAMFYVLLCMLEVVKHGLYFAGDAGCDGSTLRLCTLCCCVHWRLWNVGSVCWRCRR